MHSSSLLRSHIEDVHLPIEAAVSSNLSLVKRGKHIQSAITDHLSLDVVVIVSMSNV